MTAHEAEDKLQLLLEDARRGVPRAQRHLANRYLRGDGVPQDVTEGVCWLRRAAAQGLATAQRSLGELLEEGVVVARNLEEAVQWYRRAAAQGDPFARQHLQRLGVNS